MLTCVQRRFILVSAFIIRGSLKDKQPYKPQPYKILSYIALLLFTFLPQKKKFGRFTTAQPYRYVVKLVYHAHRPKVYVLFFKSAITFPNHCVFLELGTHKTARAK